VNQKFLYLLIDLLSIFFPLVFSFHPKIRFYKHWRTAWAAIALPAVIFIGWDIWFTGMGVWGFNPQYITGVYFINLPVEEVLFFICVPYACLFTYQCVNVISGRERLSAEVSNALSDVLAIGLCLVGLYYHDRWYTVVTFISTAVVLAIFSRVWKVSFMGRFYFAYLFILIPFFIVNGILTGTGLPSPIVWYKNLETMRLRMGTIPVEDAIYGMLLLVLNVALFEYLEKRRPRSGPL